eukprot:COSAG02_NODE_29113_length_576_cov_0.595388_2_plen_41_part_01
MHNRTQFVNHAGTKYHAKVFKIISSGANFSYNLGTPKRRGW